MLLANIPDSWWCALPMSRTLADGSTYISKHRQIIFYLLLSFIPIAKYEIVQQIPVQKQGRERGRARRMILFSKRESDREREKERKRKNLKNEISSMALANRIRTLACAYRCLRANHISCSFSKNRTKKDDTRNKKKAEYRYLSPYSILSAILRNCSPVTY